MLWYVAIIHPFLCSVLYDYHTLFTHFAIDGHSPSHPTELLLGIFFVYTCVFIFIRYILRRKLLGVLINTVPAVYKSPICPTYLLKFG